MNPPLLARLLTLAPLLALPACDGEERSSLRQLTDIDGNEGAPVFSPDGRSIVFAANGAGDRPDLALVDVETGGLRWLTSTGDRSESDPIWLPDGSAVLLRSNGADGISIELRQMDTDQTRNVISARWKPDRPWLRTNDSVIAFTSRENNQTRIFYAALTDESPTLLAAIPGSVSLSGWTADGNALVGREFTGATQDLILINATDGSVTGVTDHPHEEWSPTPSPTDRVTAFYSTYDDNMTDIQVVDLTSGLVRNLTNHPTEDFGPAWSADGKHIAFLSDRRGKSGLWRVEVATASVMPIRPDIRSSGWPVWSPRGDAIAIQRHPGNGVVYSVPADGSRPPTPLTPDTLDAEEPEPSPDGRSIVFHTTSFNSEGDAAVINLETGGVRSVTQIHENVSDMNWVTGDTIIVRRNPGGWWRTANLWIMDGNGSFHRQITFNGWARTPIFCGGFVFFRRPVDPANQATDAIWRTSLNGADPVIVHSVTGTATPTECLNGNSLLYAFTGNGVTQVRQLRLDGRGEKTTDELVLDGAWGARAATDGRIAYVAAPDGQTDIYVWNPTDSTTMRVTHSTEEESAPAWSSDGREVFFSTVSGDVDLWLIHLTR